MIQAHRLQARNIGIPVICSPPGCTAQQSARVRRSVLRTGSYAGKCIEGTGEQRRLLCVRGGFITCPVAVLCSNDRLTRMQRMYGLNFLLCLQVWIRTVEGAEIHGHSDDIGRGM
ncbi:hypothetical protein D3C75_1035640 [compost metagenome]